MAESTNGNPSSQEEQQSEVCVPQVLMKFGDCQIELAKVSGKIETAKLQQQVEDLNKINELQTSLNQKESRLSKCLSKNPKAGELQQKEDLIKVLNDSIGTLTVKIDSQDSIIQNQGKKISTLEVENSDLKEQINSWEKKIFEPEILALLIALFITLIISITMISLKRGLTITKGNTTICLGEKKRTRTKKVD